MFRRSLAALFFATTAPFFALGAETPVSRVDAVGMTVSDMDRSVAFYSQVLTFEKVSDVEVWGEDFEARQGVFGSRLRIVRMRLGGEEIELTEYLAPRGRPIPSDSRSARLRITALRATEGPGIELLEYLTPRDGRPMPLDERANDLIHWQTLLVSSDARSLASDLLAAGETFISPGLVEIEGFDYSFAAGFLLRDPDGHVMQVMQKKLVGAVTRR